MMVSAGLQTLHPSVLIHPFKKERVEQHSLDLLANVKYKGRQSEEIKLLIDTWRKMWQRKAHLQPYN